MSRTSKVVVVGASHAGSTCAALLRQRGFTGEIILLEAEEGPRYERPPLSKNLLGKPLLAELFPDSFYADHAIALHRGVTVRAVDRAAQTVTDGDRTWFYDRLVLATGARARELDLPGARLRGVHQLRTLGESAALEESLRAATRIAVVGGGWIGLEVAAAARSAGVAVVVVEQGDRLLGRIASPELSTIVEARHRARGTDLVLSAKVVAFEENDGAVAGVVLADGSLLRADLVVLGVGASSDTRLAAAAGLECGVGVVVDDRARTTDPSVYAIGDMTLRPLPGHPGRLRLESIPSATEQARQAVADILGEDPPTPETPWFWSDQFGDKIRMAGTRTGAETTVVRTTVGSTDVAIFHLCGGRVTSVETIGSGAAFMWAKRSIRNGTTVDPNRLVDSGVPLKELG